MMSAAWHQLHQNRLMSPAWTSFQPSAGVEYATAGLFIYLYILKLAFQVPVYSKRVLMFLAASSKECGMVFDCISV